MKTRFEKFLESNIHIGDTCDFEYDGRTEKLKVLGFYVKDKKYKSLSEIRCDNINDDIFNYGMITSDGKHGKNYGFFTVKEVYRKQNKENNNIEMF